MKWKLRLLICPIMVAFFGSIWLSASLAQADDLIIKILKHLDLWNVRTKPPPCANGPPTEAFIIYEGFSAPSADDPPSLLFLRS